MIKKNLLFLLFILILNTCDVIAQDKIYDLQSIGVGDGLINNTIFDVLQDEDNYIWVSTVGGIVRYDGTNFKNYTASFFNISEYSRLFLGLDKDNRIWFCENNTFYQELESGVFDIKTEQIHDFETISNGLFKSSDVYSLNTSKYKPNVIFIVTKKGVIYKYDTDFEKVYTLPVFKYRPVSCELATDGSYWITHDNNKILHVDSSGQLLQKKQIKSAGQILKKMISREPALIFESYDNDLQKNYWQIKNGSLEPLNFQSLEGVQILKLDEEIVVYIHEDTVYKQTKPFVGKDHTSTATPIAHIPGVSYNSFFEDKQGVIWITSFNGVHKIVSRENHFDIFQPDKSVRGILLNDQELWVGSYQKSTVQDMKTGAIDYSRMPDIVATAFTKDTSNSLWIGTSVNKLFKISTTGKVEKAYKSNVYNILQIPFINPATGRLWIGTEKGLSYLDKSTDEIISFEDGSDLDDANVKQIYHAAEGIWIVTNKGLFLMDATSEMIIEHYTASTGFPTANFNYIHKDKAGVYWLGTKNSGLLKWQRRDNKFRTFNTSNGLSNNTIYAVYEDDYNYLWLPSNYGLMRFNKSTFDSQVFTVDDGIADNEFNTFSHYEADDGSLFFGGIKGITSFHPVDFLQEDVVDEPLYLTSIEVLKRDASDFQELNVDTVDPSVIELNYDDQILRFDFSFVNFEATGNQQYAYKIEGFHNQWIYTKDSRVSIFNFPYGAHNIRVKAKGASDRWSINELVIPIHVNKPFYLTWQFILFCILSLILAGYVYLRLRTSKLRRAKLLLESEVESRTKRIAEDKEIIQHQAERLKELDLIKERFFSNITHELRTPLTLIIGPLEQIVESPPEKNVLKKRLESVINNARHILGLINQLLDISKVESQQMPIHLINDDIVSYTVSLTETFQPLAIQQEKKLIFKSNTDQWVASFDKDKWGKIVYNLISNALKFTPPQGQVTVTLNCISETQDLVELQVSDTGVGIKEGHLESVFDRFYQVDNSNTRVNNGTGIGLSLVKELVELQKGSITVSSEVNKGSTFKVTLPAHKNQTENNRVKNKPMILPDSRVFNKEKDVVEGSNSEKVDILIVEDNEGIRLHIAQCLGHENYNITMATNGVEGIEKAMNMVPDLIISDVMMPEKDGFELVETLRKHISTSHIPIVLLTAKTAVDSKLLGLQRGADSYLTKPFNHKELNITVENLIKMRRQLQARYAQGESLPNKEVVYEKEDQFITTLRAFILENLSDSELNGDVIGQHMGLSRIHLYRKLKALTNVSITEFVKDIRLEKSRDLVAQKQLNVSEIAYEVGFTSPSHFSRVFKAKYGKSPSQM